VRLLNFQAALAQEAHRPRCEQALDELDEAVADISQVARDLLDFDLRRLCG